MERKTGNERALVWRAMRERMDKKERLRKKD